MINCRTRPDYSHNSYSKLWRIGEAKSSDLDLWHVELDAIPALLGDKHLQALSITSEEAREGTGCSVRAVRSGLVAVDLRGTFREKAARPLTMCSAVG